LHSSPVIGAACWFERDHGTKVWKVGWKTYIRI